MPTSLFVFSLFELVYKIYFHGMTRDLFCECRLLCAAFGCLYFLINGHLFHSFTDSFGSFTGGFCHNYFPDIRLVFVLSPSLSWLAGVDFPVRVRCEREWVTTPSGLVA